VERTPTDGRQLIKKMTLSKHFRVFFWKTFSKIQIKAATTKRELKLLLDVSFEQIQSHDFHICLRIFYLFFFHIVASRFVITIIVVVVIVNIIIKIIYNFNLFKYMI